MNNTLSKFALFLACVALVVGIGGYFYPQQIASVFGGATCSGVSNCTAFPGILRSDTNQTGASAPLGSGPLTISTTASTSLASNFDCLYDAINVNGGSTSTAVSIVLPTATSTNQGIIGGNAACLSVDGASDNTMLIVANATNTVTIATSTGDTLVWNASTSVSGISASFTNVLPSSSLTYYVMLTSYRTTSSTVVYTLSPLGSKH